MENPEVRINKLENKPKMRNLSMDILRILAMFFIVGLHLLESSLGLKEIENTVIPAAEFVPLSLLHNIFAIGVNLFFLLSGYFRINLRISKVISLVIKVYLLYLLSQLIALAAGIYNPPSALSFFLDFLKAISKYWFVAVYLLLCIASPLLNIFAESLSQNVKGVVYFLIFSVGIFMIGGFIADLFYPYFGTGKGYLPLWAWVVYLYGRLIKIYSSDIRIKTKNLYLLWAAAVLINFALLQIIYFVFDSGKLVFHFYSYNNPFIFLAAASLFIAFSRINVSFSGGKAVSFIAGHTLSVYLIHSNNPLVSPYRGILITCVNPFWARLLMLIPNMLCLYALGVAVDIAYEYTFGKLLNKLFLKLETALKKHREKTN